MSFRPRTRLKLELLLGLVLLFSLSCFLVESKCSKGCDLALASYYVTSTSTLSGIAEYLNSSISDILSYNTQISSADSIQDNSHIIIPYSCDCIQNGELLAHIFEYTVKSGDTYTKIANTKYANLTTVSTLQANNNSTATNLTIGSTINVIVNCSCGNKTVSTAYGLFITYPLRSEDSLSSVASYGNVTTQLLQSYNPGVNFSNGTGLVYIPTKDWTDLFTRHV